MKLLRIDVVSIFDLRFDRAHPIPWPLISAEGQSSRIASRLRESFSWIFYGEEIEGFQLFDLSSAVPDAAGAVLRINSHLRVGSFMIWRSFDSGFDPHAVKAQAWAQSGEDAAIIEPVFHRLRTDRIFPFLAIQVETVEDQLDSYVESHAEELGRILTGDLEGERPSTLRQYIKDDLSLRAYEKLFLRWTEALAVYAHVDPTKSHDQCMLTPEFYEKCMFRAVQIFEHCILAQVSLIATMERMDHFSRHLVMVTPGKWFRSRELFSALSATETNFVVYPRTQSVEANRLLAAAQKQFGLPAFLASAKSKGSEVRDQFEWAKTQALALIAVLTYLLDKIIGWDQVKSWIATLFHHL